MAKIKPRKAIEGIFPYKPGKPVDEVKRELGIDEVVKLASNESCVGPSPLAMKAILNTVEEIHRYPEGSGHYLVEALADKLGFDFDQFILGNGANDLIEMVVKTFVETDENIVYGFPSFIMYEIAAKMMDAEARRVELKDYRFDLQAILDRIDNKTKIVFIANPNNPTGTIVTKSELDAFMAKVPDNVLVVLDEAYYDFVEDPEYPQALDYLRQGKTVMIMRSFSKTYGIAGLRLGWAVADAEIIYEMQKIRQPFNANILAQAAGLAALGDEEHLKANRDAVIRGRDYLYGELDKLGLEYVKSEANFVIIDFKSDITEINAKFLAKGMIIRPMAPWGYKQMGRVTVGTDEENAQFIEVVKEVINE